MKYKRKGYLCQWNENQYKMEKKYPPLQSVRQTVNEPVSVYSPSNINALKTITQAELDAECLTLQASKEKLIEKIHKHFHS